MAELAGDQIKHGAQTLEGAEAAGPAFHGLNTRFKPSMKALVTPCFQCAGIPSTWRSTGSANFSIPTNRAQNPFPPAAPGGTPVQREIGPLDPAGDSEGTLIIRLSVRDGPQHFAPRPGTTERAAAETRPGNKPESLSGPGRISISGRRGRFHSTRLRYRPSRSLRI